MNNNSKKLTRSNTNKMICGVCGGIGDYLGIDPTVVRLIWLILGIGAFGSGLIIYLIAAVVVPQDDIA